MSTDKAKLDQRIAKLARERFGFEKLHRGQLEGIRSVVSNRDTLVVMPTGSGKSAIYEIAGLMLPGPTIVVSPLLALQRDQVKSMREDGLAAAALNPVKGAGSRKGTLDEFEDRKIEFLLLAPEQFAHEDTLEEIKLAQPSLFVVDEAHCISEWGQDFRPEYLRLGAVIEALGHPVVLAMTATASEPVRREIVERLGMRKPQVLVQGFDRPNIWLGVEHFHDEKTKQAALVERVVESEKPGIVYAGTRGHVEEIAAVLGQQGVKVVRYHAGMKPNDRRQIEKTFLEGRADVIAATNAFGMGIDRADVRFVFHYDVPESIDAYWQEVGRAGRDDLPASGLLFYRPADLNLHRFFSGTGKVDADQIESVAEAIEQHEGPTDAVAIAGETDLSKTKTTTAITRLEEVGAVAVLPDGDVSVQDDNLHDLVVVAAQEDERRRQIDLSRVEMMRAYAELHTCRRHYLLQYFGEQSSALCGNCDNDAGPVESKVPLRKPFAIGSRVRHVALGEGTVHAYEGDEMIVLFDQTGYKTLLTDFVISNEALQEVAAS